MRSSIKIHAQNQNLLFTQNQNKKSIFKMFYELCKSGDIDQVNKKLEENKLSRDDLNDGLQGACSGGHIEIVKLFFSRGADDLNGGLIIACNRSHRNIVDFLVQKGANDFYRGLRAVCCWGGDIEIAKLMIELGRINNKQAWNKCLKDACMCEYEDIAEFMIQNGADDLTYYTGGGFSQVE